MAGGESDELNTPREEQWVGAGHERTDACLPKGDEDRVYLSAVAGVEHFDLLSDRRCRSPHLSGDCIRQWIVRIEQETDEIGARQQLSDQAEQFFRQPAAEEIH